MRVLVVDDNLLSRARITSQLRAAGWEATVIAVDPAALASRHADGADAVVVNLAADGPPLAVAMDRATEFVRALTGSASWAGVPVLGFCGHTDRPRREAGLAAGCTKVATNAAVATDIVELVRALAASRPTQGGQLQR
jgi:CheY-like chemotaxis protein